MCTAATPSNTGGSRRSASESCAHSSAHMTMVRSCARVGRGCVRPKGAGSTLRMQGPGPTTATSRGLVASRVTASHMRVRGRMGWKMPAETMSTRLLIAAGCGRQRSGCGGERLFNSFGLAMLPASAF